ncbi:MAG: 50S ribosomal protein L2 [Planctomycetes bacterium]|nr:50S ribosomal protein L2 [Planctomycetota bacterium]
MAIKSFRPVTPSLRHTRLVEYVELTDTRPNKRLTEGKRRTGCRNNNGRMTVAGRGGGHKRRLRIVDNKRNSHDGIQALVHSIEYDPNRTGFVALLHYDNGDKAYIIAAHGMQKGLKVMSGDKAEPRLGNCLPLKNIPQGLTVHNVELHPGKGGQIARGAGSQCVVAGRDGEWINVQLPSGEVRRLHPDCRATIGQVSNLDNMNVSYGKAGRRRWLGLKPKSRGVAQNPVDHPLGGGNDRTGGGRVPVDKHGNPAKGSPTRKPRKPSNALIVRSRRGVTATAQTTTA